jgi:nitrous oxidase accessory protein NosD
MIGTLDPIYAGTNATIGGNTLINGTEAIFVDSQNRVYNNTIANFSSGITIRGINSLICLNTITNCSNAVSFFGSNDYFPLGNNLIWYNSFVNNSKLVALYLNSSLSINRWDNGKEGNYWSSYNGSDGNSDRIGDTPYILAQNCTDNYPLIQPYTMASAGVVWGNMFFAAATVTALAGAAVIICVYTKFRERS